MIYQAIGLLLIAPFAVAVLSAVVLLVCWRKVKKSDEWKDAGVSEFIKVWAQWVAGGAIVVVFALYGLLLLLI